MAYLEQLNERIVRWWAVAQDAQSDFMGVGSPVLSHNVTELDAASFLQGLDSEPPLYRIADGYKLFSELLPLKKDGGLKQWNLFERKAAGAHIRDETIAHYGAMWELTAWHGWARSEIFSEPEGDGVLNRGSIDGLIRPADPGRASIAIEAKGDDRKLDRLISEINDCEGDPRRGHPPTEHRKCQALQHFHPGFFWGVACGPTRCIYRVDYRDELIRLVPERDPSHLEST